jgi:hypothetical protein
MRIVLRESGGLGNQLFQYAALRYYAKRYGADMRIAVNPARYALSNGYPRPCLLRHFSIPVPMKERSQFDRIMLSEKPWLVLASAPFRRIFRIQSFKEDAGKDMIGYFRSELPIEPGFRTLYLGGYYENNLIVQEVAAELRRDLTFRQPPEGKTLEMMEQISRSKVPVSIHVRRGDTTLPHEGRVVLQTEYYADAIALIKERFADPTFFVFSDDMPFVKEHLPLDAKTVFVDHNDDFTAHEDLRLMSSCHHHIIANSTFSWWGAWLNPRSDKTVIAPKRWFVLRENCHPNLFPDDWILKDFVAAETFA